MITIICPDCNTNFEVLIFHVHCCPNCKLKLFWIEEFVDQDGYYESYFSYNFENYKVVYI